MFTSKATKALRSLKKQIEAVNLNLSGEQLQLWESSTEFCVITLIDSETKQAVFINGINVMAKRDMCLAISLINFVKNHRTNQALAVAA